MGSKFKLAHYHRLHTLGLAFPLRYSCRQICDPTDSSGETNASDDMNFKPADFFLGIVDFLGVLVPGAVLAYLLDDRLSHIYRISPLHVHWLAFAAVSYLFGHLLLALTESFNWLAG